MNSVTQQQNNSAAQGGDNSKPEAERQTKQASGKQLVAVIFILAMATKIFLLPVFLIQSAGRDAYVIVAIYCAFELVTLVPMIIAVCIADADIFELLSCAFGRVGAKIITVVVWLFLFFKLNIAVAEILTFYGTNVLSDFDTSMMVVVLLVFLAAAGTHTLRTLGRLNEIAVPIIVICLAVLVVIVVMTGFDLGNIFPIAENKKSFSSALISHAAWVGDFTPLMLFVGRTKTKKHTWCFATGAGALGLITAVFFAVALSAAFGNVPMLVDASTNISNILQFSVGNVYGRIDMFSSILWSVSVFIEAALFFYVTTRCCGFVIGRGCHFVISLVTCVMVYVVQVFAFTDHVIFSLATLSKTAAIFSMAMTVTIPVLSLVCAAVYKKRIKQRGQ